MKSGEKLSEDLYLLKVVPDDKNAADKSLGTESVNGSNSSDDKELPNKKIKTSSKDTGIVNFDTTEDKRKNEAHSSSSTDSSHDDSIGCLNYAHTRPQSPDAENEAVRSFSLQLKYIRKLISCLKFLDLIWKCKLYQVNSYTAM